MSKDRADRAGILLHFSALVAQSTSRDGFKMVPPENGCWALAGFDRIHGRLAPLPFYPSLKLSYAFCRLWCVWVRFLLKNQQERVPRRATTLRRPIKSDQALCVISSLVQSQEMPGEESLPLPALSL